MILTAAPPASRLGVTVVGAAVVVLGILLPWLGLVALVAAGVLVPLRLLKRRAAVEAPVPPQG